MSPLLEKIRAGVVSHEALPSQARLEREAEALAAPLPPLRAGGGRIRQAIAFGAHGQKRAGLGESFWQFRRFQEGDFRSDIDWRASARHRHLHVREREREVPIRFHLYWSSADSMGYRSDARLPRKGERAAVLMLALARLLERGGESVARESGASLADTPRRGAGFFVLAGDFLEAAAGGAAAIPARVAAAAPGLLVQIVDPSEEAFPFRGRVGFSDAGGAIRYLLGNAEECAAAYRRRFAEHGERLATEAKRRGWSMLRHRTDESAQDIMFALHRHLSLAMPTLGAEHGGGVSP